MRIHSGEARVWRASLYFCYNFARKGKIMFEQRWLIYALAGAFAAGLNSIFGKVAMRDIDSNLATTIRSIVMTLLLIIFASAIGVWSKLHTIHGKALTMIVLSGVAGAVSWLFFFAALQIGTVSQVAPIDKMSVPITVVLALILLGERPSAINWLGVLLVALGGYLVASRSRV
jgi:transporter family protein